MTTVLMAGGGTGGHVFPMVAVAHALQRLDPSIRPVFVGTERGMETRFVPKQGFELELLKVLPIRGGGASGAIRGAVRAAATLPESRELIRRIRPKAIFSIGGYAAGPVSLVGRAMGLPVALMEPNSVIGLANLLMAPFISRAYTAFALSEKHFSQEFIRRYGVPLRPGFEPKPYARSEEKLKILVLGGSQGAKALNEVLPKTFSELKTSLSIVHQCGHAHLEAVRARYKKSGYQSAEIVPFIEDMPRALENADLVVGRAGAGAVSEILAVGRPSLLIPYPFASGDHQRLNAQTLEEEGAARVVLNSEATAERLGNEISDLINQQGRLEDMAQAATRLGRPHAADEVARDFLELADILP